MWNKKNATLTKKAALLLIGGALAVTFSQNGRTQGPCIVERGLDPLDVLNSGVRHNVWIILDTSGSMERDFQGNPVGSPGFTAPTRIDGAKAVLTQVMNELVDATGAPLVNWGFVNFAINSRNTATECDLQFQNACAGLDIDGLVNPPPCGGADNRDEIIGILNTLNGNGFTPNGISLDQLSNEVTNGGFVSGLLPDQRNFFIIVTDGDDTCECRVSSWDTDATTVCLRRDDADPSCSGSFTGPDDLRAYNAGLKGRVAYERLNPTATDRATGALGSSFVIGMGLNTASRNRANHLAWEASGASYANPNAESALFADTPEELLARLRDALAKIGLPETEVNLGTSVVGSVKELIPDIPGLVVTADDVLADMATPDEDDVRDARELRRQLQNNVLFATSVETPGFKGHLKATNVYTVTNFGANDEARLADTRPEDQKRFWDAGELLQQRDPDDRTILFHRRNAAPGDLPLEFRIGSLPDEEFADLFGVDVGYLKELDPTGFGAKTKADAARIVIQVIRGYRLVIDSTFGFYLADGITLNFSTLDESGERTWKLLDPTLVGPAVVQNPPRSPDRDPPRNHAAEYGNSFPDGFYWDNLNRQTMVYLSTNGGTMHGFRADNGAEMFAYIPADALGDFAPGEIPGSRNTLKDLVPLLVANNNGIENHRFFIAGSVTVEDVFLTTDDQWHTAIAFGRGKGGKFITALDVSTIGDWDGNVANTGDRLDLAQPARLPRLLFTVGNRQGVTDLDVNGGSYDGLGETWSVPVMGNVQALAPLEDQWVLFVGSGYGCNDPVTGEGQFLYVLRMEDGSVYQRFQTTNDLAAPIPYNGLVATPTLYNPHSNDPLDDRDFTTRVYISDLQGNVYKLDCSPQDPSGWTFEVFFQLGLDQPVTAAAAIKKPLGQSFLLVFVGTGGDQRVDSNTTLFQFVAIKDIDPQGGNSPGELQFGEDLPPGERVLATPAVAGDMVFFASTQSTLDLQSCTIQFTSLLFAREVLSGLGVFDLDVDTGAVDNPLDLGEGKTTGLFVREDHLYVSMSGNLNLQGETLIMGQEQWDPPQAPSVAGSIQLLIRGFRISPF